jgi:transposase InsO family protein
MAFSRTSAKYGAGLQSRLAGGWIQFYNHQWPHQALEMQTPPEAFGLAA